MSHTLINIGLGNTVVLERIVTICVPGSSPMKRLKDEAREEKRLVDATQGRKTRSLIITDSNHVILSSTNVDTLGMRISNNGHNNNGQVKE